MALKDLLSDWIKFTLKLIFKRYFMFHDTLQRIYILDILYMSIGDNYILFWLGEVSNRLYLYKEMNLSLHILKKY